MVRFATATTKAKPEAMAARFYEPEPAATKAAGESGALGVVADAVEQADDGEDCAPPHACVQIVEDYFDDGRVGDLIQACEKNQHAIDQQRNAYEEPD